MILIEKNREPKEWLEYRQTNVNYESKPKLVESLYNEQGYICAYCMRRIPCRDRVSNEDHRVEHMLSRENHPELQLDYKNMVICCPGHIGTESHCDKLKGSKDISFTPHNATFIGTLSYSNEGVIKSSNAGYDKELNETLNLNTSLLVSNRKAVINIIVGEVKKHVKDKGNLTKAFLNEQIQKYSNKYNKDGKLMYHPYCGVAIYYLQKKLNKMT